MDIRINFTRAAQFAQEPWREFLAGAGPGAEHVGGGVLAEGARVGHATLAFAAEAVRNRFNHGNAKKQS